MHAAATADDDPMATMIASTPRSLDIPESLARLVQERKGTRAHLSMPREGLSVAQAHALLSLGVPKAVVRLIEERAANSPYDVREALMSLLARTS